MKVKLSKNGREMASIDFGAHEPHTGTTVFGALECLEHRFLVIPNADSVIKAFIDQRNRTDNSLGIKYIADVNGDMDNRC